MVDYISDMSDDYTENITSIETTPAAEDLLIMVKERPFQGTSLLNYALLLLRYYSHVSMSGLTSIP